MIPYGQQDINQQDIEAVLETLQSDFLTQGPRVPAFEKTVAEYCQVKHAFAVNSATSALHIACLALGVEASDIVWTTPVTFVASANCALYCGADVDFVDINPETFNLCPQKLEEKLKQAASENRLPKVLIPVHLCGLPCDMRAIKQLADEYDIKIIEDASHAIGGRYEDLPIGSCQYSDITVFSFHPVKIITTAEGGMAVTNQSDLAEKMALYRSHGITREPSLMTHEPDGPWYYQQVELGFNYRMTELQAALGVSQMHRLDAFVAKRHQIADRYDDLLKNLDLTMPVRSTSSYSGLHLYVIQVDAKKRLGLFNLLRESGIGVNVHYIPVHTQPYYRSLGFKIGDFPGSEYYYSRAISLPMYPNLTENDQNYVVAKIKEGLML
ncbi:UDP-4-amino-4,6-dideoxy-N-acetyl-beta-L-altrosamine transaminase [Endozoicomonas sp. OPT23]|uniref:UDP-4-amino-4, 6-dideoxy-N-acetyl-beta-L-altrosamine transaminase n=1 Tax=Endozoicomonas sp. OPT23 TaxID=2072845 RepID=UPI00129B1754|nr:UDP-4-amino-4,6-dideoxy-N-acetyl-beta-L-altrosamine transaminase [Endozoicomonas sp. OPT23]MRI34301.1 UDP-4-amino-4,6-dideoxy-N-acetyl-beta-L-altrosamine transaminase [Endozoicomonas sp. OPT23]